MKINLTALLFLIFLTLKLTDHIDWSWWWVTSPLWIPLVFAGILFAVIGVLSDWGRK